MPPARIDGHHPRRRPTVPYQQLNLLVDDEGGELRVVEWTLLDQHCSTLAGSDFPRVSGLRSVGFAFQRLVRDSPRLTGRLALGGPNPGLLRQPRVGPPAAQHELLV